MKKFLLLFLLTLPTVSAQTATIDSNVTYQTIEGWGASTGYQSCYEGCPEVTPARADLFWSEKSGIGLQFIRTGNTPDGLIRDLPWLLEAQARGAKVFYSFLSPPHSMISSDKFASKKRGYLRPDKYADYANYMVRSIQTLQSKGVKVYAVSVQNEPDTFAIWSPHGSACGVNRPTISQCLSYFVANHLGPAWTQAGLGNIPLGLPEDGGWFDHNFIDVCMADSNCAKYISFIPSHDYDGASPTWGFTGAGSYCCAAPAPGPASVGSRPLWMTEVNGGFSSTGCSGLLWKFDPGLPDALVWAHNLWGFLTLANVQSYMYYNLWGTLDEGHECNDGLTNSSFTPAKRYYVFGNWSKFVRSGWLRIEINNPVPGVYLSAFKAPDSSALAIVAVNSNRSPQPLRFLFQGLQPSSVTPYITDATRNLTAQPPIPATGGSLTATLPPLSVTSYTATVASSSTSRKQPSPRRKLPSDK